MIVFLCAAIPSARSGYGTRSLMIVAALAAIDEVRVVVIGDHSGIAEMEALPLPNGRSAELEHVHRDALVARLQELAPGYLVAAETALAPAALAAGGDVVVLLQNVESALWSEIASTSVGQDRADAIQRSKMNLLIERQVLNRASQVWAVSEDDAKLVSKLVGAADFNQRVAIVPNVVNDPGPQRDRAAERGHGVFFGSLWWKPNEQAVVELATLSRRLTARAVSHRFSVAGQGASDTLRRLVSTGSATPDAGSLELVGFVPDLGAFLDTAACAILPVLSGGGSMVKLIEAMRFGVPVITTPQGARGIAGLRSGVDLLVLPPGREFDDMCVDMLNHPEAFEEMGRRGRQFVREHLSLSSLERTVAALMER